MRAMIKEDLEDLEKKKDHISQKRYEKIKRKYEKRLEKIRMKIKQLEERLQKEK